VAAIEIKPKDHTMAGIATQLSTQSYFKHQTILEPKIQKLFYKKEAGIEP
jgi:hypothetical protein